MRHAAWVILVTAGCGTPPPAPAAPKAAGVPPAIDVEGVPEVPRELAARLAQYQAARGASFEDFGPDGSILVSTRFGETSQLHVVPFPGGRREQITFFEEPVSNGAFIPGTSDVLFSMGRGGDENYQIYRLDRKAGKAVLLTDGKSRNGMGPLSRKGDRLVYSSNKRNGRDTDLYLLDLKTGASEMILEAKGEFWSATDWSHDDARLLLLKTASVNESRPFILDLPTRTVKPLPVPEGKAAHGRPSFGPGDSVYVTSDAEGEHKRILEVDLRAGTHDWFSPKPLRWDVESLDVNAEGLLAIVHNEDGASSLVLGKRGLAVLPLALEGPVILSGARYSRDGKRLGFTLSRPNSPPDAYTFDLAGEKLLRWTFSETGGLDPATFVVPGRISYRSFDGREIPAYVYRPRGAAKAPVVISIHGGPEGQSRPSFSPLTQFWVNELGLAVVVPNVRGSTGYGKTYVALDNGEKREDAVKDIGALLDWIATQPGLDASRVAVHGGSYGGYMVLASLVHYPDRIKAGVDIVGIANWITFLEKTSAYRVDLRRVEYGDERNPEMRAFLERISPAGRADRIRSALMVVHGRNDPRVPFFEAELIASKVRAEGRPVWTVYAANEGHGFARKENRDYLSAATALFFRDHLLR
jgi:dipeptidyl aminopeptidase/acylaminoacyl peptidase